MPKVAAVVFLAIGFLLGFRLGWPDRALWTLKFWHIKHADGLEAGRMDRRLSGHSRNCSWPNSGMTSDSPSKYSPSNLVCADHYVDGFIHNAHSLTHCCSTETETCGRDLNISPVQVQVQVSRSHGLQMLRTHAVTVDTYRPNPQERWPPMQTGVRTRQVYRSQGDSSQMHDHANAGPKKGCSNMGHQAY